MQQLILDGEVRVPIADPCRPDSDTEALEFLAGALSALRGQPTCRFGCAFELLEQVERVVLRLVLRLLAVVVEEVDLLAGHPIEGGEGYPTIRVVRVGEEGRTCEP